MIFRVEAITNVVTGNDLGPNFDLAAMVSLVLQWIYISVLIHCGTPRLETYWFRRFSLLHRTGKTFRRGERLGRMNRFQGVVKEQPTMRRMLKIAEVGQIETAFDLLKSRPISDPYNS